MEEQSSMIIHSFIRSASLGISTFYFLLTSAKNIRSVSLGISTFYYLLASANKIRSASLGISTFYYVLTSSNKIRSASIGISIYQLTKQKSMSTINYKEKAVRMMSS